MIRHDLLSLFSCRLTLAYGEFGSGGKVALGLVSSLSAVRALKHDTHLNQWSAERTARCARSGESRWSRDDAVSA